MARETSPGRRNAVPPPRRPAGEIEWCGARNGGCVRMPRPAQQAGHRVQLRCLERLLARERGQDGREAARQHGLAGPGRAHQETLWPPAAATSSARRAGAWPRISERSTVTAVAPARRPGTVGGSHVPRRQPTTSDSDAAPTTRRPSTCAASSALRRRHDHAPQPRAGRRDRHRQHARRRNQLALQRQLAGEGPSRRPRGPAPARWRSARSPRRAGPDPAPPCGDRRARGSPPSAAAATGVRWTPPPDGSGPARPGPPRPEGR